MNIEGFVHFLTLVKGYLRIKIETRFSQKPLGHFQPNLVSKFLDTRKLKLINMMVVT